MTFEEFSGSLGFCDPKYRSGLIQAQCFQMQKSEIILSVTQLALTGVYCPEKESTPTGILQPAAE